MGRRLLLRLKSGSFPSSCRLRYTAFDIAPPVTAAGTDDCLEVSASKDVAPDGVEEGPSSLSRSDMEGLE